MEAGSIVPLANLVPLYILIALERSRFSVLSVPDPGFISQMQPYHLLHEESTIKNERKVDQKAWTRPDESSRTSFLTTLLWQFSITLSTQCKRLDWVCSVRSVGKQTASSILTLFTFLCYCTCRNKSIACCQNRYRYREYGSTDVEHRCHSCQSIARI